MRIAHVNVARGYRGGERQTELLIRELAGYNVLQTLVARANEPLTRRLADVNIDIKSVSRNRLRVASATKGADLVHVHEGRSVYAAYLQSLRYNVPYVITRRVDNPIGDNWLAHRAYRGAACVAAVAQRIADVVHDYDPLIPLRVIHSGASGLIPDRSYSEAIRNLFPGKFLVGHVAALDNSQKGQEYIIRVAEALRHSHPQFHFLLVGGGRDELMLREAAAGLNNLTFTGFVHNVGDYLAAFDLFLLPSNREGIGAILLDAMEQGIPVIATRVGGVPEIVRDGENGILIDPARPDQLGAAILRLYQASGLRFRLAARGRQIAGNFSAGVMCRKYMDLYQSVVVTRARRVAPSRPSGAARTSRIPTA